MDGETVLAGNLLSRLLQCSESSARLARIFRAEDRVFGLLVEEKSSKEKNQRFVRDFKTLADVLVQVNIKRRIEQEFPTIGSKIQGEEQNSFENILGDCIKVEISEVREETVSLLCQVLEGNARFAERIADVIYAPDEGVGFAEDFNVSFPADRIGIWIDPIDSTLEYIQGKSHEDATQGIAHGGLASVCVIIGAYDLETGDPLLGVVNQPFYSLDKETGWMSKSYWGMVSCDQRRTSIVPQLKYSRKIIVTSSSEDENLLHILRQAYNVVLASGAGYKCLLVARGDADLYVLSQGSTYFWDTCGPHALLAAQGGGVLDFQSAVKSSLDKCSRQDSLGNFRIRYLSADDEPKPFQNSGGLLAYRDPEDAVKLLNYLRSTEF